MTTKTLYEAIESLSWRLLHTKDIDNLLVYAHQAYGIVVFYDMLRAEKRCVDDDVRLTYLMVRLKRISFELLGVNI